MFTINTITNKLNGFFFVWFFLEPLQYFPLHICVNGWVITLELSSVFSIWGSFNLLKPTGHVMHHQFNIQQLYALPTLYLCVLYLSQNKQRLVPLTA